MMTFYAHKLELKFHTLANSFRFFDLSNTGFITSNEFILGTEKLGIVWAKKITLEIFNHLDHNSDNKLNFFEFSQLFNYGSGAI